MQCSCSAHADKGNLDACFCSDILLLEGRAVMGCHQQIFVEGEGGKKKLQLIKIKLGGFQENDLQTQQHYGRSL